MRDSLRKRPIRLPRPAPYRSLTIVVILVVLATSLLVLDRAGRLGGLRGRAQTLLAPILQGLTRFGDQVGSLGRELNDTQRLREEIEALREENSQLKAQQIQFQAILLENERLREQIGIQRARPWKLIGADVVMRSPDAGRRVVLLAIGSEQGVQPGMAVISKSGSNPEALIGVVDQVGPHSATVLLITDFSSSISARVYYQDGVVTGILQGQWQRGSRLTLEEVDRTVSLKAGDVVVTAGLTAQFELDLPRAAIPKNVPIGTIESTRLEDHGQVAELRPFVDPDQARYAWVILSTDE